MITSLFKLISFKQKSYYDTDKSSQSQIVVKEARFDPGARYSRPNKEGSYERRGDRIIKLGLNV